MACYRMYFTFMYIYIYIFPVALRPKAGHSLLSLRFLDHTHSSRRVISSSQRPLPENTQHSKQTSMPPAGFEPTISAGERPQTHAFDRATTGIGIHTYTHTHTYIYIIFSLYFICLTKGDRPNYTQGR